MKILNSDSWPVSISYCVLRKIIGIPVRLFLVKKVYNQSNIPQSGPAILAFNHQSFFDFICFASVSPRNVHFLAAEKFFEHWAWRLLMIFTGQIRVDRNVHDKALVHDLVARHYKRGTLLGVFPEGTRSPYRDQMMKAFTGVALFALKHNMPIVPVGIRGTYDIMSRHDKWPRIKKIVTIHIGKPLLFPEHIGKHELYNIRTQVTEDVIREIEQLSGKTYLFYEQSKKK